MDKNKVTIYTDGSGHTQLKTGAWAAIIFIEDKQRFEIEGMEKDTTHQRMELMAVINSLHFIKENYPHQQQVLVISDSQYVVGLAERKQKLSAANFLTKKGKEIQNVDLVKRLYGFDEVFEIQYEKIKSHSSSFENNDAQFNNEVDQKVRKLLRDEIKKA